MPSTGKPVSDRDLEDALRIAARVVDLYGDMYWPVFERLERELEARRDRTSRLHSYLDRRSHAGTDPDTGNAPRRRPNLLH